MKKLIAPILILLLASILFISGTICLVTMDTELLENIVLIVGCFVTGLLLFTIAFDWMTEIELETIRKRIKELEEKLK